MTTQWIRVIDWVPPAGECVRTMIEDAHVIRHVALLVRKGNLWFLPDMSMYVYYTPTHWAPYTKQ